MKIRAWNTLRLAVINVLIISGIALMPSTQALAFLYDLTVAITPTFSGSVRDDTSIIDCPGDCNEGFLVVTDVTLTAYPEPGYRFDYWSGDLTGSTNTQTLSVTGFYNVTAHFKVNTPPVLDMIGDMTVTENEELLFDLYALDDDGDALTYWAHNLPPGAEFHGRLFTWTPNFVQAGEYQVIFGVNDGDAAASETITITVLDVNRPPHFLPIGDKTVQETTPLEFTVTARDPDADPIIYSAEGLPAGTTFNTAATPPLFQWVPTRGQAGTYEVVFYASDDYETANQAITITVTPTNGQPLLNPIPFSVTSPGETVSFQVTANDPDDDHLTFSVDGLPSGASFDAETGFFEWTPEQTQIGLHEMTFRVNDGVLNDWITIVITVRIPYPVIPEPFPYEEVYPQNGQVGVFPQELCLSWPETEHATHYDILVSDRPDFSTIATTMPGLTDPWYCIDDFGIPRDKSAFKPYQCYYWNVVAHNRYGEAWYPIFGFTTTADGPVTTELHHPLPMVDYRMISIPLHPHDPNPVAVLGKTLGPYDPSQWRLFWYSSGEQMYHEYPHVPDVSPGTAYWLIVARNNAKLNAQGFPVSMEKDFIITIPPGFFQLGCPFPFPVKWGDVSVKIDDFTRSVTDPGNDWMSPVLWSFKDGSYLKVDILYPWEGYWVENLTDMPVDLIIPPKMAMTDVP